MIIVAGIGPGNTDLITKEVIDLIKNTKNIIAFGRVKESIKELREDVIKVVKVADTLDLIDTLENEDILILASGDPLFFGIVNFLKNKGIKIDKVLPGLSSFQYLMAKLQMPWQDAKLASIHGRDFDFKEVLKYEKTILLTDRKHKPNYISKKLKDLGLKGRIITGHKLSYEDEIIQENIIGEEINIKTDLAIVVIINEMD